MHSSALRDLIIEGAGELSPRMAGLLRDMARELEGLTDRTAALDKKIVAIARDDADMRRLMTIPGIGPAIASAPVAAVGKGHGFCRARDLSAWRGLVPHSDRPDKCLSRDLSAARERHAVRLCLEDVP